MRLIYSGKTKDFTPELEEKVAEKLAKVGRLAEQRGEREVHLVHHLERHLHKVEIHLNFYDNSLCGEGVDGDLIVALNQAAEKLEKQLIKQRDRWRDVHRDAKAVRTSKENPKDEAAQTTAKVENGRHSPAPANGTARTPKVFRVNYGEDRKPMTLEEAMMEISGPNDYVVYRDADRNCLSVLVQRQDGNYDLIES